MLQDLKFLITSWSQLLRTLRHCRQFGVSSQLCTSFNCVPQLQPTGQGEGNWIPTVILHSWWNKKRDSDLRQVTGDSFQWNENWDQDQGLLRVSHSLWLNPEHTNQEAMVAHVFCYARRKQRMTPTGKEKNEASKVNLASVPWHWIKSQRKSFEWSRKE